MILGFQAWETGKIMAPLKETGMQKGKLDRNKVVLLGNTHLSGGLLGLQMANCFPYILWEGVRPTALMRCSVPVGAAAAAALAGCAGAWGRRRAAGEPAGRRAWQVSGTDRELHRDNSTGKPRLVDALFLQTIGRSQAESKDSWNTYLFFGGH